MSQALVPITPVRSAASARPACAPRADFVAHLIAGCLQAPQTRARRRGAPADAVAAYGAIGQWPTPAAARAVTRSLNRSVFCCDRGSLAASGGPSAWISTWRCEVRTLTVKPTRTSTRLMISSRKKVEVPARPPAEIPPA